MFLNGFILAIQASLVLSYPVSRPIARGNSASVSVLSTDSVDTFHEHALLSQAAYCSSPQIALPTIDYILTGGDGGTTPRFFVGRDPASNAIVVAHEGTNAEDPFSVAIDAQFIRTDINTTLFPSAPSGVEVHDGFAKTFALTADQILSTVQKGLSDNNANTVLVSGHSLGAALATMTAVFLKENLANTNISTVVFGLPRVGNQAWADFVDATLPDLRHMHNKNDPVPTVPPELLGFVHPSGEVYVQPNSPNDTVFCPGQENSNCSDSNEAIDASIPDHLGPYTGLQMGRSACPAGSNT
ncbi:alpha/beta-hydrolase [Clavulina sp. PMI_390]|nr:alpha/beta-hydrolase [Clavulina sp. PMI_390]